MQLEEQRKANARIYFCSPYCKFYFENSKDLCYEGEVEWPNKTGDCLIRVHFDTDTDRALECDDLYEIIPKMITDEEPISYEINDLSLKIDMLRPFRPKKCYHRLEKLLSDKKVHRPCR